LAEINSSFQLENSFLGRKTELEFECPFKTFARKKKNEKSAGEKVFNATP